MSRKDAVVLASRTLAVLLTVWALAEVSYLPEFFYSLLHYANQEPASSSWTQYQHHHYVLEIGFRVARILGFALMARWLHKGGPEIEELLLPERAQEAAQN
jgi:hypothetical protein